MFFRSSLQNWCNWVNRVFGTILIQNNFLPLNAIILWGWDRGFVMGTPKRWICYPLSSFPNCNVISMGFFCNKGFLQSMYVQDCMTVNTTLSHRLHRFHKVFSFSCPAEHVELWDKHLLSTQSQVHISQFSQCKNKTLSQIISVLLLVAQMLFILKLHLHNSRRSSSSDSYYLLIYMLS